MPSHPHTVPTDPQTGHREAPPTGPAGNLVLSQNESARTLGISTKTLERLRGAGGGPVFVQLSARRIGYRRTDLEVWLASRRMASTSAATVAREGGQ